LVMSRLIVSSVTIFGACFACIAGEVGRQLSFAQITNYEPGSDVVQHSRIDLDQQEMESHLGLTAGADFAAAKNIYQNGANSGAYAQMTLSALGNAATSGYLVKQGTTATGYVKSTASAGATSMRVTYTTTCKVGGTSTPDSSGCFTTGGGSIEICASAGTPCTSWNDLGAATAIQNQYRTLAGFSTAAEAKMSGQVYFERYKSYYSNQGDYSNRMVLDALDGTGTCSTCDETAREQIAKKTSAYMGVWMYVIREMEDAINDCQSGCINCNDDPVHAWDEAVAFYSGSLEGTAGSSNGKLLYRLAEKRCSNFGTCGAATSVNTRIIPLFTQGKNRLLAGECSEIRPLITDIVELMMIPMIQGSLRYAYKVAEQQGGSKEKAEGVAFSNAVLPMVSHCSASAATTISNNMAYTATSTSFADVKSAFESVYSCLGLTCDDIGGLIDTGSTYLEGAAPCSTVESDNAVLASASLLAAIPIITSMLRVSLDL
jgi:hypothetical protein